METGLVATTTTTTTTRPQYVPSWGIWTAKLSLRCVQVALAAAVLGLTGSIYGMEAGRELPFIIASAPIFLALIWDTIEGLAVMAKKHHRGLPPPSVVAMDLLVWLALIGCNAGLGVIGMATDLNDTLAPFLSGSYRQGSVPPRYRNEVQQIASMGLATVVLVGVLISLHFSTFSIACYETRRRKHPRQPTVIVMQNSAAPAPRMVSGGQVYYQVAGPPPSQTQQQQVIYVPVQGVAEASTSKAGTSTGVKHVAGAQPGYTNSGERQQLPPVPLIHMAGKR